MVGALRDRPPVQRALLDALCDGPGTVRRLHRRIGAFTEIALRLALHRLVAEGAVVWRSGRDAKIYRLAGKTGAPDPRRRPARLTPVQLDMLRLVAATGTSGMSEGVGAKKNVRRRLLEAGLVCFRHRHVARLRGVRVVDELEMRWFATEAGRMRLQVEDERKTA